MKKALSFLLFLAILLGSVSAASAAFPTAEELFGAYMPSAGYAIDREPDEVLVTEEGTTESYSDFTLSDLVTFGRYLAFSDCDVRDFDIEAAAKSLKATVSKTGQIEIDYGYKTQVLSVFYPEGTRPEKEKNENWTGGKDLPILFPFDENVFRSYFLPSVAVAVGRAPDSIDKDGGNQIYRYSEFSDDDYNNFSRYLAKKDCSVASIDLNGGVMSVTVEYEGTEFVFEYDREKQTASVTYPADRRVEAEDAWPAKVESIKILFMDFYDLTPEENWPILHVGEKINIGAAVYPRDIHYPAVKWSCGDTDGKYLQMTACEDGTVDLVCVGSVNGGIEVTAACSGAAQSIRVFCCA